MNNGDKYPSVTKKKTHGAGAKLNKFEHKVKIIGDSHLKCCKDKTISKYKI